MENAKMRFTDFPPCKHRFGCLQCRNDIKFVEHMKKRFGDWECPEKIPFGTPLELMPEHIKTKLETYQNNRISQGKDIPQIKEKNLIGSGREMPQIPQSRITSFLETPGCSHRIMCVECRNNELFREKIKNQMGDWVCPENIPLNTPLELMPQKIKDTQKNRQEQQNIQKERLEKIRISLDGIEEVIPEQALGLVDTIRAYIFPDKTKESFCKFNTGKTKEIEQKCCGGKIKMVPGFVCEKHGDASSQRCRGCQDFESKR